MKWVNKLLTVGTVASMIMLSACGAQNETAKSNEKESGSAGNTSSEVSSYLEKAYTGAYKGTTVHMLGTFVDAEQAKFEEAIKPFEEKTGIDFVYEGSTDGNVLPLRINGGNAPDIADFNSPGTLATFAKEGKIVDVRSFLSKEYLEKQYNKNWLDMATMPGPNGDIMAGVWNISYLKSMVWYNKKEFDAAGYTVPKTWEEMLQLSEQISQDGDAPWSIGIESGGATGWAATDWLEDIMLRTTSKENYDKWVSGEIPFTDPIVKNAMKKMSEIMFNNDYVYGGTKSIATTSVFDALLPLFENPPKAWLHRQSSSFKTFFPEGADADWFPFPAIDLQYGDPALISADIYAMLNDRPEVRAAMEFFTKAESLKPFIQSGAFTPPMNDADPSWYQSELDIRAAEYIKNAKVIGFDASDMMPSSESASFMRGMADYIAGIVDLNQALEEMQQGRK
ncbi:ABC transporter substrate-binding protein [Paenibacillus durus]|uniref:ABC transporter substrate-binding protein n=1 Tax=Paenibacillus durus ATCC 35681 TaxID=1333534 RepID=A0A0F7CK92_PAEDU|nr:ABC transporter substrate-binding protein [Paenibacillus durus]AKG37256.1 ABC transporter substrate-binding protein [Paenibacillus durus ATCC 35681]